ncbi:ParB/RepB/Spo0J family partition protein [Streptomyces triculaminicus]|uniref:ParB/RepB/Spo0J family partition protein n=1 Tax=Streptomyces triculaminicus TaxID=2816232 RepID=UPI0037D502B0
MERADVGVRYAYSVRIDNLLPADSPRLNGLDEEHARQLAEKESELPPILVHRTTLRVIDGMHRIRAAELNGRSEIAATFFDGSAAEAFLRSVVANISHGLPLSMADRKAAAGRILTSHPLLSDRAVAAYTGLAARSVGAVRRRSAADSLQVNVRIGTDGKPHPLNRAAGRIRASEVIAERPDLPLREIARVAGISVGTAHDVRTRLRRGEAPVPATRAATGDGDGAGRVRTTARTGPDEHDGTRDPHFTLRRLAGDPSLRQSESGRELLRWLHTQVAMGDDWKRRMDAVPPHCADAVAELARQCSDTWRQIAREMHRRTSAE